jgi:plasmid stabilization system protein ParE
MSREIILRPEAETELAEAFEWYEERVPGLGSEFLLAVDAVFRCIIRNPQMYPVIHKAMRRALVRRFPYQVLFVIETNRVVVLAVFHVKRNPKRWQERS